MAETKNLIEGVTDEIIRVLDIKKEYDALPNNAGLFASKMVQHSIEKARKAQASGDVIEIIRALNELREFEL